MWLEVKDVPIMHFRYFISISTHPHYFHKFIDLSDRIRI